MLEIVLGVIPSLTSGVLVFLLTNQLKEKNQRYSKRRKSSKRIGDK